MPTPYGDFSGWDARNIYPGFSIDTSSIKVEYKDVTITVTGKLCTQVLDRLWKEGFDTNWIKKIAANLNSKYQSDDTFSLDEDD